MKRIDKIYTYLIENSENYTQDDILKGIGITTIDISENLGILRNNVSKELNTLFRDNKIVKIRSKPVLYYTKDLIETLFNVNLTSNNIDISDLSYQKEQNGKGASPFTYLIGNDLSLKNQIEQAKAAIMYPPNGLHSLIIGSTGVGKSLFVNIMYKYALHQMKLKENSPFIVFNCADYSNNPQLLLSHIFGHVKGSFTGAEKDTDGIVKKADGGILFLDEIHRLPPEGQEMIFYFMDTGTFNKLGESDRKHKANVLIIGATTEDPSSTLLNTFIRRIPITIKIPDFNERTLEEQVNLLKFLLNKEAIRINKPINISSDSIKALIGSTTFGNIGQLKSNIQLACAKGFLNSINNTKEIDINLDMLPSNIKRGLVTFNNINKSNNHIVWSIIPNTLTINPNNKLIKVDLDNNDDKNIYSFIEKKATELKNIGMEDIDIKEFISSTINNNLNKFYSKISNYENRREGLLRIVDNEIVLFSEEIKFLAEKKLNKTLSIDFVYAISLHLSSLFKRLRNKSYDFNNDSDTLISNSSLELEVAKEIHFLIQDKFKIKIPRIEIEYLSLILTTIQESNNEKRVGIVVAAHGLSTATSMVNVAEKLFEVNNIVAVDMPIEKKPLDILEDVIDKVKAVNEGKGVLLLVDMGSLNTFSDLISERTNILTKSIDMVSTPLVLEAVRKCSMTDSDLLSIYSYLLKDFRGYTSNLSIENNINDGVIITICSSGQGTAKKLKELVDSILYNFPKSNITVIPISLNSIYKTINNISKNNKIICAIGIKNPSLGIPFISIENLIDGTGEVKLKNIIEGTNKGNNKENTNVVLKTLCKQSLNEIITFLNPAKIYPLLKNFITFIEKALDTKYQNNTKLSLMIHLACALERVLLKDTLVYTSPLNSSDKIYFDTLKEGSLIFKRALSLELSNDEIYYMIDIIKEYQNSDTLITSLGNDL